LDEDEWDTGYVIRIAEMRNIYLKRRYQLGNLGEVKIILK
jgi:hypothetical protein